MLGAALDAPVHCQVQVQHDREMQSDESCAEQGEALDLTDRSLDWHMSGAQQQVNSMCITGSPGCGKQVKDFQPTKVMAAPEGCKQLPNGVVTKQRLEELGWRLVSISPALVRMHATGGRLQTR